VGIGAQAALLQANQCLGGSGNAQVRLQGFGTEPQLMKIRGEHCVKEWEADQHCKTACVANAAVQLWCVDDCIQPASSISTAAKAVSACPPAAGPLG
jgi:hypothetical protein